MIADEMARRAAGRLEAAGEVVLVVPGATSTSEGDGLFDVLTDMIIAAVAGLPSERAGAAAGRDR